MPVAEFQRQVHEKNADIIQLELNDQALDTGIEVVEALAGHARGGQQRIALFAHDRHQLVDRAGTVLALVRGIMAQGIGDIGSLIEHTGAYRTGIDLYQAHQIGVLGPDEVRNLLEHASAAAQITRSRDGQMKGRSGPGGITDVVDQQSHGPSNALYQSSGGSQYTGSMSQRDPIRVFVTHCFEESDDYVRVFEYLESALNFYYRNCGNLTRDPVGRSQDAVREELRRQISAAEVIIALASLYPEQQDMLIFELNFAKASDKPVVLLPLFGREQPKLKAFDGLIDESVAWDERALVDAVKRQARHEDTTRWDTIEFKLD